MSPRESPNTCLSLRATTMSLRTATRELILMLSSLLLRATTSVRPTPGRFFFCLFFQGGWLPCATTLSLRVTMRSNTNEVPLPMAGRGPRPNRTRARCLSTDEVQKRTSLPARNVLVVVIGRRRTYEGARVPRCGASTPNPPIKFEVSPGWLNPDGPPAPRLSRLVSVCVLSCGGAERFLEVINTIIFDSCTKRF